MIYLDSWTPDFDRQLDRCLKSKDSDITILHDREWEIWFGSHLDQILQQGRKVTLIVGGADCAYYKPWHKKSGLKLVHWPSSWFFFCLTDTVDSHHKIITHDWQHRRIPWICMNNQPHRHRAEFVDLLYAYELDNKGTITWIDPQNMCDYEFKYFSGKPQQLDDQFVELQVPSVVPDEYHLAQIDIITEATDQALFVTEKPVRAILHEKPWLALAARGYHQLFRSWGFELYEDLFDYAFDQLPSSTEKIRRIKMNLLINQLRQPNLDTANPRVLEKCEYNLNHYYKIIKHWQFVPVEVKELINRMSREPALKKKIPNLDKLVSLRNQFLLSRGL